MESMQMLQACQRQVTFHQPSPQWSPQHHMTL
jgi:hypothetical protein